MHERVDNEDSQVEMSEGETTMATPRTPQSTPLEGEWIEKASGHPDSDENAEPRNSTRPPEDPGDATDDDARHPDEPTEPPDDAESVRVRDGEERVEARVSEASRGRADKTVGPDSATGAQTKSRNNEGVPGSSEDDPEDPGGATDRRDDVEVEPGGETKVRRSRSVAHGHADADTTGASDGGTMDTGGVEGHEEVVEDAGHGGATNGASGESWRVASKALAAEETRQHPKRHQDSPVDPPAPPEPPDGTAKLQDQPPSAELEGEWNVAASCEVGRTSGHTDVLGVSEGDEDPRNRPKSALNAIEHGRGRLERKDGENSPEGGRDDRGDPSGEAHASGASACIEDVWKRPKKLRNTSERVRERSERKGPEDSPGRPRDEPDEPGGETLVPGGVQNVREGPRNVRTERVDGTNAPSRNTGQGWHCEAAGVDRGRARALGQRDHH